MVPIILTIAHRLGTPWWWGCAWPSIPPFGVPKGVPKGVQNTPFDDLGRAQRVPTHETGYPDLRSPESGDLGSSDPGIRGTLESRGSRYRVI
jgi:hypothetical protein